MTFKCIFLEGGWILLENITHISAHLFKFFCFFPSLLIINAASGIFQLFNLVECCIECFMNDEEVLCLVLFI